MECTGNRPLCICSDGKTRGVAPGLTIMLGNEKPLQMKMVIFHLQTYYRVLIF